MKLLLKTLALEILSILVGIIIWPVSAVLAFKIYTKKPLSELDVSIMHKYMDEKQSSWIEVIESIIMLILGSLLYSIVNLWLGLWVILATITSIALSQIIDDYNNHQ